MAISASTQNDVNATNSSRFAPADRLNGLLEVYTFVDELCSDVDDASAREEALPKLRGMLQWLAGPINMSPITRDFTKLDETLKNLFEHENSQVKFPAEVAAQAKVLYDGWNATGWTGRSVAAPVAAPSATAHACSSGGSYRRLITIAGADLQGGQLPPDSDPIWGPRGIMYGAWIKKDSVRKVKRPDLQARSAKDYGHNNLDVGAWFPNRTLARIHGAHGTDQSGIYGDPNQGAFAVVVSEKYDDLDQDQGDVVLYSAEQSHYNSDPNNLQARPSGARSLHSSIRMQKPVRLIRSCKDLNKATFTHPSLIGDDSLPGYRYDGLYRVVSVRRERNEQGGLYERFRLERLTDQVALSQLTTPTARQIRDYQRINTGYGNPAR